MDAIQNTTTNMERGDIAFLRSTVDGYCTPSERDLIDRAYSYAVAAHAGKVRYSGEPYIIHPVGAAQQLANRRLSAPMVAAGLLHDVMEDAGKSPEELRQLFGKDIAGLVEGVTKISRIRLQGQQRYIENLRKMFVAMAHDIRVIIIKFCDRIHNLETLQYVPEQKRERIALESLEIHAPIANRLGMFEMKAQLEDLAFPFVLPREAAWLESLLASSTVAQQQHVIAEIQESATDLLERHRIAVAKIEGRPKSRYSLYQKLIEHERDIAKIYDFLALRVIVEDIADCYTVLGLIHQRWKPVKGRIKDYIANPKPNGYQSIHTTVRCLHGSTFEFQIRTRAMHEDAEWGAAAAWRYHERGIQRPRRRDLEWVDELVRWQRDVKDPEDFIAGLKREVLRDRILVFTPKGDVIDLPEGATPLDFAYSIHTEIGNHAVGARVNNAPALHPLDKPMRSGDIIEIITDPKRNGPSADWLALVKTTHAREKIRDALRGNLRTNTASWIGQPAASAQKPQRKR